MPTVRIESSTRNASTNIVGNVYAQITEENMFQKATRKSSKLRLALTGPSGSGKTFSSLQIAKGLGGRIAMIDTERGSGTLYANVCDYDVLQLDPPYEPKKYIQGIRGAEEAGYNVLIIDSLSHAWCGEGGILTIHDRVAKAVRNSFDAWREVTPQHNQLVDAILASSCHVIVTMRTKTGYEVITENGKTKVNKVGLAPIQREGLEYEFTVVMDLSIEGHVATASKDRTGLFDGIRFSPGSGTGSALLNWLEHVQEKRQVEIQPEPDHQRLLNLLAELELSHHESEYALYAARRYEVASLDALSPEQIKEQSALLQQCKDKLEKLAQFEDVLRQQKRAA